MHIDRLEKVAGQPILKIRDMLRLIDCGSFAKGFVADRFDVSIRKAEEIIREMRKRGWIEPKRDHRGKVVKSFFSVSSGGLRLCNARAVPRLTRAKADALLRAFVARCEAIDRDDDLSHYVISASVFGSYLTRRKEIGDLDLVIDLQQRPMPGRDILKHALQRAEGSGRNFSSYIQMLAYSELEVWRLLKNRSPYISLHPTSDPVASKAKRKPVFKSKRFGGR